MAKPKAKTLQQQLGFFDSDLKKPEHDEIMIWLDNNTEEIITSIFGTLSKDWVEEELYYGPRRYDFEEFVNAMESVIKPNKPPLEIDKIWEYPITRGKDRYIVGFCDLLIRCNFPTLSCHPDNRDGKWHISYDNKCILFEVKTQVSSLGEVIRQIRMYQEYTKRSSMWFLVSPDDSHVDQFISQEINFIKYDPDAAIASLIKKVG